MGRHSARDDRAFYRSLSTRLLPWVLFAAVAAASAWVAIDAGDAPTPAESASHATSPRETPTSDERADGVDERKRGRKREDRSRDLRGRGASVQVLDGTGGAGGTGRVEKKLERLGFDVVTLNRYDESRRSLVFWSARKTKRLAKALADLLGWEAKKKPPDLSPEVDLHVLVSAEET